MSASFVVVHLSDIHFGQEKGDNPIHQDAREELLEDAAKLCTRLGHADAIIVTGDVAFSGKQDQYDRAGEWLGALSTCVGCQEDQVLVVPGNHDVDRDQVTNLVKMLHNGVRDSDLEHLNENIREVQEEENACAMLLKKLVNYQEFASRYGRAFASFSNPHWRHEIQLESRTMRFVGLNTVLFSDSNADKDHLALGPNQYVLSRDPGVSCVTLLHHPFTWLKDGAMARQYISSRSILCLLGHEHVFRVEPAPDPEGHACMMISAGATNPPASEGYEFRYNWLRIAVGESRHNGILGLTIWPRAWVANETRFGPDRAMVDEGEFKEFELALPRSEFADAFRERPIRAEAAPVLPEIARSVIPELESPPEGPESTDREDRRFRRLQFLFWKKLKPNDRLRVLLKIQALPEMEYETSIPWLRHGLESARVSGRLHALWEEMMFLVPEDEREANPFPSSEEA